MTSRQQSKGFTLIEMMVVIAIIGVLVSLAGTAVLYGAGRARLNNTTYEIASMLSLAQMRAQSSGISQFVIFYEKGDQSGVVRLEREESTAAATDLVLTAVDPLLDATTGGVFRDRLRFTSKAGGIERAGMAYGPLTKFGASLLPPYSAISLAGSGGGTIGAGCTFCVGAANGSIIGAIRFAPDGTVSLPTAAAGTAFAGGAVAITNTASGEEAGHRLIVVTAPAGSVKILKR